MVTGNDLNFPKSPRSFCNVSVTVTALPTASISYTGSPWCSSAANQSVTLTGTNAYTGGTYTVAPSGLTLDANTGQASPSTSTAGSYTVTYTNNYTAGSKAIVTITGINDYTGTRTATLGYSGKAAGC